MIVSLPNGKVVEMSLEQYLNMDDDDYSNLIAYNYGEEVQDPFHGSVLLYGESSLDYEEEEEESLPDLTEVDNIEKLKELDAENQEN